MPRIPLSHLLNFKKPYKSHPTSAILATVKTINWNLEYI